MNTGVCFDDHPILPIFYFDAKNHVVCIFLRFICFNPFSNICFSKCFKNRKSTVKAHQRFVIIFSFGCSGAIIFLHNFIKVVGLTSSLCNQSKKSFHVTCVRHCITPCSPRSPISFSNSFFL